MAIDLTMEDRDELQRLLEFCYAHRDAKQVRIREEWHETGECRLGILINDGSRAECSARVTPDTLDTYTRLMPTKQCVACVLEALLDKPRATWRHFDAGGGPRVPH